MKRSSGSLSSHRGRRPTPRLVGTVLLSCGVLAVAAPGARGQTTPTPSAGGALLRRADLQRQLETFEQWARSPAYSSQLRSDAASRALVIRDRLELGDFRTGDRVFLRVDGEPALTDTFTVDVDGTVALPLLGAVPLRGVLRSELQDHLQQRLARFLQDPALQAQSLVRVSVVGAVARPGYYAMPSQTVFSDALMVAGGLVQNARVRGLTVERGGNPLWEGQALQEAMMRGLTLDELGIRAGDQIVVPAETGGLGTAEGPLRALSLLLSLPFTLVGLGQIF